MRELYPFQAETLTWLSKHPRSIIALPMGTGKSAVAIEAVKENRSSRILVVCPNSLKYNWKREIEIQYENAPVLVLDQNGTKKKMIELLEYNKGFIVLNYESLRGIQTKNSKGRYVINNPLLQALMNMDFHTIIFDEGHRLKNRKAQCTFGAFKLAEKTKYLYLLTGTPILNRGHELYPYLHMIDNKKYSSYWDFIGEHFADGKYPNMVVYDYPKDPIKTKNELKPYLIRKTKKECLPDLPPKTIQKIWLDMEGEQQRIYNEMAEKMIAELKVGSFLEYLEQSFKKKSDENLSPSDYNIEHVISPIVLTKMLRLKQICLCPYLISSESKNAYLSVKIDALMEIITGTDEKIAVFSQFKQGIELIAKEVLKERIGFIKYTGDTNLQDRDTYLRQFNEDKNCRVFLGTSQLGIGFNLQENCSTLIFTDKLWNPAQQNQVEDRIHRINQLRPVTIIELLCNNSIENDIELMLNHKQGIIDSILGKE